jgi:N-succinyldiaminopimelate aminotransferase
MTAMTGLQALAAGAILSPFTRINRLLEGIKPGHAKPIEMTAGDPKEAMPGFVIEKFREAEASLGSYPRIRGTDELRNAIGTWIGRRYGIAGQIDTSREILPTNGSREALFFAAMPAVGRKIIPGRPVILMPNPFYQAYLGACYGTNAEPVFLNATEATGHLPNLDELENDVATLERTAAFYLCSPANPQGAVASPTYVRRALALARKYDFMLFFDECYSEIYSGDTAPTGGLQIGAETPERYKNLIVFNSLSKRSNLPGMRSGFAAGDGDFLETMAEIRNLTAPQLPGPIQHASAAVWSEEQHVTSIRQAYRTKFDICDQLLKGKFNYQRPAAGFFLWLDVSHLGGGIDTTVTFWKQAGVKVTPGAFLAQDDRNGFNPGRDYIRVALVHDPKTIQEALNRIVSVTA